LLPLGLNLFGLLTPAALFSNGADRAALCALVTRSVTAPMPIPATCAAS